MSIADKLRKAASYFVELPPQTETPESEAKPSYNFSEPGDAADPRISLPVNDPIAPRAETGPSPVIADAPRTVEQIVRESEGPNLEDIQVAVGDGPPPQKADGTLDFEQIYAKAGLPGASFTAEQMIEMLVGLPANMPLEMKRQTVMVTVNAMGKAIGATPETIVADASRKIAAIAAYAEGATKQAQEKAQLAEMEIELLLKQVEAKRGEILAAREAAAAIEQACEAEVDRLDDVLAFFSAGNAGTGAAPPAGTSGG
jgi:hypothetical protein